MPARGTTRRRRSAVPFALACVAVAVLLVPSAVGLRPPSAGPAPAASTTAWQKLPGANSVFTLASTGPYALGSVLYNTGFTQLVLFDALHNRTHNVTQTVPGYAFANYVASAGGMFLVQWQNLSTGRFQYERVTTSGAGTTVATPLGGSTPWILIPGNGTDFFAAEAGHLLALDPTTLAIVADYSKVLPNGVSIDAVASSGANLYLAGSRFGGIGAGGQPFAGVIATGNGTLTPLLAPIAGFPTGIAGDLYSLAVLGADVYFGGELTRSGSSPLAFGTDLGYLFDYNTTRGTMANVSGVLPAHLGVFGVFAAGGAPSFVLDLAHFTFHYVASTGPVLTQSGETAVVPLHGTAVVNRTSLTGNDFVALVDEASASGGFYFVGGTDTGSNMAQLDAVRLSAL